MTLTGTIKDAAKAASDSITDVIHDFSLIQRDLVSQNSDKAKTQIWLYPPINNHVLGQSEFSIFFGKQQVDYQIDSEDMETHIAEMETLFQRFNSMFSRNPKVEVVNCIGQSERDVSILGLTGYIVSYTVKTSFRVC